MRSLRPRTFATIASAILFVGLTTFAATNAFTATKTNGKATCPFQHTTKSVKPASGNMSGCPMMNGGRVSMPKKGSSKNMSSCPMMGADKPTACCSAHKTSAQKPKAKSAYKTVAKKKAPVKVKAKK